MSDLSGARPDRTRAQHDPAPRQQARKLRKALARDASRPHRSHASGQHTAPHSRHAANQQTADTQSELTHALNLAFADLGGAAFALAHHGTPADNRLAAHIARIHQLYTQLEQLT